MTPPDTDRDSAIFDENRKAPSEVTGSAEFREWQSTLPTIDLDGETLYLAWGDVPMDENQIANHWARSHALPKTKGPAKRSRGRKPGGGPEREDRF